MSLRSALLTAAVAGTLAVSGCGDGTSGDGTATERATSAADSAASTPEPGGTAIPDDFPLSAGMGGPQDTIATSRSGTGLRDLSLCDTAPLRGLGVRDRLVADNSGGEELICIRVMEGSSKSYGAIGDIIMAAVKEATPGAPVKKGEVVRAVIVRTAKEYARPDGSHIRFNDNAAVLLNPKLEPIGTRIFGPVTRELRTERFMKIVSLAPEVL